MPRTNKRRQAKGNRWAESAAAKDHASELRQLRFHTDLLNRMRAKSRRALPAREEEDPPS